MLKNGIVTPPPQDEQGKEDSFQPEEFFDGRPFPSTEARRSEIKIETLRNLVAFESSSEQKKFKKYVLGLGD
jgi:hypothetical protein